MKNRLWSSIVCICAISVLAIAPTTALAEQANLNKQYLSLYKKAQKTQGKNAPGRNIVKYGIASSQGKREAKPSEIRKSLGVLKRIINPPVVVPAVSAPVASTSVVTGGGAGGELAAIRQCESGGNYSTNTGNGYYGAYQFDQQTWQAAGGSGMPHTASPAEQDRVAANWIAQGHRSAWPNC